MHLCHKKTKFECYWKQNKVSTWLVFTEAKTVLIYFMIDNFPLERYLILEQAESQYY